MNTIISTNAVLLTEEVFKELVESGLDNIQVSFFAGNAEDHKFITGSNSFNRVANNIRRAWKIKKDLGVSKPYIQTFMMEAQETKEKVEGFLEEWGQYVDKVFSRPLYNVGRDIEGLTPTHEKNSSKDRYPCITPWYSTAIRSNGDVMACYMFHWYKTSKDIVVGNINKQSLSEIWASEEFQKFRQAHLTLNFDDYPVCGTCDLWDAYTNIWEKGSDGKYFYSKIKSQDYFNKVYDYRGG